MKHSLLAILFICSTSLFAETLATKGHECSGEMAVPSFNCLNPVGGADVRLYIMEFQTCKNNNIEELDRTVTGMNIVSDKSVDDIHSIGSEDITINYSSNRVLIDAKNRVDNLSFVMPTDAIIKDGTTTIEMKISNQTELDFKGAASDQVHFKGTFKIIKADGNVSKKGKLQCFVNR